MAAERVCNSCSELAEFFVFSSRNTLKLCETHARGLVRSRQFLLPIVAFIPGVIDAKADQSRSREMNSAEEMPIREELIAMKTDNSQLEQTVKLVIQCCSHQETESVVERYERTAAMAYSEHQLEEALQWWSFALLFLETTSPTELHTGNVHFKEAQIHCSFGRYPEAEVSLKKSREICLLHPEHPEELRKTENYIGLLLIKNHEFEEAEALLMSNIDGNSSENRATTLLLLGSLHRKLGETERALLELQESRSITETHCSEHELGIRIEMQIVKVYRATNRRQEANELALQALERSKALCEGSVTFVKVALLVAQRPDFLTFEALLTSAQFDITSMLSQRPGPDSYANEALNASVQYYPRSVLEARCRYQLSLQISDSPYESEFQIRKAIQIIKELNPESKFLIRLLGALARRNSHGGISLKSPELIAPIYQCRVTTQTAPLISALSSLIYSVYDAKGVFPGAEAKCLEIVGMMLERYPTSQLTAALCRDLGVFYASVMRNHQKAQEQFEIALRIQNEHHPTSQFTATLLAFIGTFYQRHIQYFPLSTEGKYVEALSLMLQHFPTSISTAELLTEVGFFYQYKMQDDSKAEELFLQALTLMRQYHYPSQTYVSHLIRTANFHLKKKRELDAEAKYSEAVKMALEYYPAANSTTDLLVKVGGFYAWKMHNYGKAEELYLQAEQLLLQHHPRSQHLVSFLFHFAYAYSDSLNNQQKAEEKYSEALAFLHQYFSITTFNDLFRVEFDDAGCYYLQQRFFREDFSLEIRTMAQKCAATSVMRADLLFRLGWRYRRGKVYSKSEEAQCAGIGCLLQHRSMCHGGKWIRGIRKIY